MENETREIVTYGKKIEHRILVDRMKAELNSVEEPLVVFDCCIYKVPEKIRQINEAAYTPRIVSIGPIHHGDKRLKSMEELKLAYMKFFLDQRTNKNLEDIVDIVKKGEASIRRCYAQNATPHSSDDCSDDDFVRMILVDACFIIEFFLRYHEFLLWFIIDPIISKPWWINDIKLDLILLENQIPFFILEDIFTHTRPESIRAGQNSMCSSFLELSFDYFKTKNKNLTFEDFCEHHLQKRQRNGESEHVKVKHFTDLVRRLYLPRLELQPERKWQAVKHLYSASQLQEAGVEIEMCEKKSITELQFDKEKGVFTIPRLEVFDSTETLLRNIVALEQCHYPYHAYITDYIQLLDFLINNSKDVDLLVGKRIVENLLGDSNKVATMVNQLCVGITLTNMSANYLKLGKDLNDFYEKPLHKYKAIFIRDYFSTPWKIASSIAAIALLLLTLIQTICSILQLPLV